MLTIISKLLAIPCYPVGMCVTLGVAAIIALALKRRRLGLVLVCTATGVLFLFSQPLVAHLLVRGLESQYESAELPHRAAAIVLLGGSGVAPSPPRRHPETNIWGDRLMHTARLFRQKSAPFIICTGGTLPFLHETSWADADNAATLLGELWGIDTAASVIRVRDSQTTREDALGVVKAIGELGLRYEIILVTSAMHMPRSVLLMQKQGLIVHPSPTDFHTDAEFQWKFFNLLPSGEALYDTRLALHEYYGLIAYKLLGWI
jgi:uncharacterized SAM-binding protein YcdF (DUF218 family)